MGLISPQVESAVLRRLKLLKHLQDVPLRPEESQALMQRVDTNTCSAEDRDLLAQVMRATPQVTAQLLDPSPPPDPRVSERPSPQRKAKRKRQLAKASRHRNRW
jgi:hypothetical protein